MGNFTTRNLNQKAVYWGHPINDGYGGYTWENPVEIDCRWVDSIKVISTDTGEEKVSRSEVIVAQDLETEGMLWLGELDSLESGWFNDPLSAGARRILRFDKTPTIKADHFFRKAYLYGA